MNQSLLQIFRESQVTVMIAWFFNSISITANRQQNNMTQGDGFD
jgi:hypothetical protein